MRILVTGAGGQVGSALCALTPPPGMPVVAYDRMKLDIGHGGDIAAALDRDKPAVVINLAAYTGVDRAEDEPAACFRANRDWVAPFAAQCAARRIAFVHLSTDYVFDGTKKEAWREDDPVNPLGVYGRSKAEGEAAVRAAGPVHVIVRTSWVFGATGKNFVRTMLSRLDHDMPVRVVDDQHGCPTAAADLAACLLIVARDLVLKGRKVAGTYHYCNEGETTWYRFAEAIFAEARQLGRPTPPLAPIATADYRARARRPENSVLDCAKIAATFGVARPPWRDGLAAVVAAILTRP